LLVGEYTLRIVRSGWASEELFAYLAVLKRTLSAFLQLSPRHLWL
jgi:hypothetical protein